MNNQFKNYASSASFRVELSRPQIAKLWIMCKAHETNNTKFDYQVRQKVLKTYCGADNFIATENAMFRKGLLENTRGYSEFNTAPTKEGIALCNLLIVAGFCDEFEQILNENTRVD